MKKLAAIIILIACLIPLAFGDELPRPRGYVNDFANIIDRGRAQQIESACASILQSTGTQIAVVTIENLNGSTIEAEGERYLMGWGVGQKGKDNGVVILVARDDRRVRIEVGYGMEGILPDGLAGEIVRYDMIPRFKQNDYGGGILAAVYKIGKIAGGEVVTYPKSNRRKSNIGNLIYFIFIIVFIIMSMFGRRRGRGLGALWFLTGFGMGSSMGGGFSSKSSGGFSSFGGFGGGMGGGGGASGGW
jgi:uncharacterized protein